MLSIQLDPDLEKRLDLLAEKTGRSKADYVQEAIHEYLEDIEDRHVAIERLNNPGKRWTMEEVEQELGLED